MKMKKMLAILAALSVLGTTGLTVGAEDHDRTGNRSNHHD